VKMDWWTSMSKTAKTIVTIALGASALIASFATIGGGVETATKALDQAITSEEEHSKDVQLLLREIKAQNTMILESSHREDQREVKDMINRNKREIDRLNRALAGGDYANEAELMVIGKTLDRLSMENNLLQQKLDGD